jgi:hypothetical protein
MAAGIAAFCTEQQENEAGPGRFNLMKREEKQKRLRKRLG